MGVVCSGVVRVVRTGEIRARRLNLVIKARRIAVEPVMQSECRCSIEANPFLYLTIVDEAKELEK